MELCMDGGLRLLLMAVLGLALAPPPVRAANKAVVVGINQYDKESGFSLLTYSENDAKEFGEVLKKRSAIPFDVRLLTGSQRESDGRNLPTRQGILAALREAGDGASGTDAILIVFLSGHGKAVDLSNGKARSYFCPIDVRKEEGSNNYGNLLDIEEIIAEMNRSKAKHRYLFVDACRDKSLGDPPFELPTTSLRPGDQGLGVDVILSCQENQVAKEHQDLRHSVFSYFLIQGLKGGATNDPAGKVRLDELNDYVRPKVRDYVAKTFPGVKQEPDFRYRRKERHGDVVLLVNPVGSSGTIVSQKDARSLMSDKFPTPISDIATRRRSKSFENMTFHGTFPGENFDGVHFDNCRFKDCRFTTGTSLRGAIMRDCVFENTDFEEIETRYLILIGKKPSDPPWTKGKAPKMIIGDER